MAELDFLTLEVGSTMTKANGFVKKASGSLGHVAQGFAVTTVEAGDVSIGVENAILALTKSSGYETNKAEIFINSSAAGGLKMSVHGLTPSMTARAAKEASLGAGAIVKKFTAGALNEFDIEELLTLNINLILLAGGVEFGDTSTVYANAEKLFKMPIQVPILYAGNSVLCKPIEALAKKYEKEVWITENVFPSVDNLNVEPVRKIIQEAFARHIVHAPGMQKLSKYTSRPILPTPGAVLLATKLFADVAGDTVVVDVGGATTDVHSVTDGSKEYSNYLIDPEPREKRTVEGDLGVFVNAEHVLAFDQNGKWKNKFDLLKAMPQNEAEKELTRWLCEVAVRQGIKRHAGTVSDLYTASGKKRVVKGKDLSAIQFVIGTGGALTRIEGGADILASVCTGANNHLFPPSTAKILLDSNYLFSALGTMAHKYEIMVQETLQEIFLNKIK